MIRQTNQTTGRLVPVARRMRSPKGRVYLLTPRFYSDGTQGGYRITHLASGEWSVVASLAKGREYVNWRDSRDPKSNL